MRFPSRGLSFIALAAMLLGPVAAVAQSRVQAMFNINSTTGAPFPSDVFTTTDYLQLTNLRVNLPLPSCASFPNDCEDLGVLNELDGFNIQPRISIPFTGAIKLATVTHDSVLLYRTDAFTGASIGINEMVWNSTARTLFVEPEEVLRQHAQYLVVVTNRIRDNLDNLPISQSAAFKNLMALPLGSPGLTDYERSLKVAMGMVPAGVRNMTIAASLFTTMSTTAILEKIRIQVQGQGPPIPANFYQAGLGGPRTVFPVSSLTSVISAYRQATVAPTFQRSDCATSVTGGGAATSTVAFGSYLSPRFIGAGNRIPATSTREGVPIILSQEELRFVLFLPIGTPPAGGWPVAIFGHGFESSRTISCFVHDDLNRAGIAVIAISSVGHDLGPLGYWQVPTTSGTFTFPFGGRGFDQNGDGTIGPSEGQNPAAPYRLISLRDAMQQTVADLIELTRLIRFGMDVDGNGTRDLDPNRIYFYGHSNGARYGSMLIAVEPWVRALGMIAPGGGGRTYLSEPNHAAFVTALGSRTPSLLNVPPPPAVPTDYNPEMPLRNEPVRAASSGAVRLQQQFEWNEWARMPGDTVGYAFNLRPAPEGCLPTVLPCDDKPVLLQLAMGDRHVPNPDTSSVIRTGQLEAATTYLRWDLFWPAACASLPPTTFPNGDPHSYLLSTHPTLRLGLMQVADYFASDATVVDPLGAFTPYWETPIAGALPETLNWVGPCP